MIGETPYAEMKGDRSDLSLSADDIATVANLKAAGSAGRDRVDLADGR